MQRFPEKLRVLRERRKLTQQQLAEQLGVTEVSIYYLESGKRNPGVEMLLKLSRILGVSSDVLIKDELELEDDAEA
jgi:transcriptional regulator with XRE-family HTH domain